MSDHVSKHLEVRQKILRCASYFQLSSRCLEMWSNTIFRVWYTTSITNTRAKFSWLHALSYFTLVDLYLSPFSLLKTEVSQKLITSGGLAPIVAMVSSEHVIMQNEALIALAVMSSTVGGTNLSYYGNCPCANSSIPQRSKSYFLLQRQYIGK